MAIKIMAKSRLGRERVMHGYTVDHFGKKIGYFDGAGYQKVESRKNGIRYPRAQSICRTLDMDFDDLFELIDD